LPLSSTMLARTFTKVRLTTTAHVRPARRPERRLYLSQFTPSGARDRAAIGVGPVMPRPSAPIKIRPAIHPKSRRTLRSDRHRSLFLFSARETAAAGEASYVFSSHHEPTNEKLCAPTEKELEQTSVGRPSVGGPFTLITHKGQPFTEKDLLGKWNLVYFGFTNCPDICPAELDKIGEVVSVLGPSFCISPNSKPTLTCASKKKTVA
jgi:hypothetical protein